MGKKSADVMTVGTSSQHEQVCQTLIEVLRSYGSKGVAITRLNTIYQRQGRGNLIFPNGKGTTALKEACRHPPYCNYFDTTERDGVLFILYKRGNNAGGGVASSQTMPQSGGGGGGGGGASCPSPRVVVTGCDGPSPSPSWPPAPALPFHPATSNRLVVDGPAAYASLTHLLEEDGRPSLIALAVNRRTRHLLLMYKPASTPSSPPRVVTIHEGALAGVLEQTALGTLWRDYSLIKATHDIYEGLGSLAPMLASTGAGVVDTQLLGELLGHPRDVSLKHLLAEAQQEEVEGANHHHQQQHQQQKQQQQKTYIGQKGKARIDAEAELLATLEGMLQAFPVLCRKLDSESHKRLARATYTRQLKATTVCADGLRPVVYVPSTGRLGSAELYEAVTTSKPLMVQDVEPLLKLIPSELIEDMASVSDSAYTHKLKEFVLDKGQRPRAKLIGSREKHYLHSNPRVVVTSDHLDAMLGPLRIGHDDRAGIDGTLHRISVFKNREDAFTGATLRVGRHVTGNIDGLRDLLTDNPRALDSILFLGVPGTGKTTLIREVARVLSEDLSIEVLIIDTSNEIAGDGDVAHPSVGAGRRMMVQSLDKQASVMIRGLQNHTPEVMIIDEIGRKAEAVAASTVKERGVAIIGSAHGDFESLFRNSELKGLLGGSVTSTLGDATAKSTNGGNKVQSQRAHDPVFDVIIELKPDQLNEWVVYRDVKAAVDAIYALRPIRFERRVRDPVTGQLFVAYGERMYKSIFDDEGPI